MIPPLIVHWLALPLARRGMKNATLVANGVLTLILCLAIFVVIIFTQNYRATAGYVHLLIALLWFQNTPESVFSLWVTYGFIKA